MLPIYFKLMMINSFLLGYLVVATPVSPGPCIKKKQPCSPERPVITTVEKGSNWLNTSSCFLWIRGLISLEKGKIISICSLAHIGPNKNGIVSFQIILLGFVQ